MPKSYTDRGFTIYTEFKDRYNADVWVQQSSLAFEECVWIFTKGGTDNNDGAIHMTMSQAINLTTSLLEWIGDANSRNEERLNSQYEDDENQA